MIWLSLKTYKEASGDACIHLLSLAKKVMQETGIPIIPCAQPTDIYRIKKELDIEVWAQHVDPIDPGRNFGWLSPHSLKEAGATGTVINHEERPVDEETIYKTIDKSHEYGLKTLVLCGSVELCGKVSQKNVEYVGYERADLIAGPKSMIDEEAESIRQAVSLVKQPLIIGAGISTAEHVKKTLEIGGKGVILASGVTKSDDPEGKLRELALAFK